MIVLFILRSNFKTVSKTMVLVEPYFVSKSAKHGVTLTSRRSILVRAFPLYTGCKVDAAECTESFVTIRALV